MQDLTVADAARISGLSPATIKRKIASGELESRTDSKGWHRVEHEALMKFLATADQPRPRTGAVAHAPLMIAQRADQDGIIELLKRELEAARERIKTLESRNDKLSSELMSLTSELRELVFGKGQPGLSAWMTRVRPQESAEPIAVPSSPAPNVTAAPIQQAAAAEPKRRRSKVKGKKVKATVKKKPGPKPKPRPRGRPPGSKNKKR